MTVRKTMASRSRRCPECSLYWPTHLNLSSCLECDGRLFISDGEPMSDEEVNRRKLTAEFNEWYEQREAQRNGPTPEEIGAEEARAELERYRALEDSWKTAQS